MSVQTLISATTGGATSSNDGFFVRDNEAVSVCTTAALGSSETVDIYYSPDDGATWLQYYYDGVAVQLTSTQSAVRLYGPMLFQVVLSATASSTGVNLIRNQLP